MGSDPPLVFDLMSDIEQALWAYFPEATLAM